LERPSGQREILFSRWNDPQDNEKFYFFVGTTLRPIEKFYFLDVCKPAATEQEKIRKHRVCLRILF